MATHPTLGPSFVFRRIIPTLTKLLLSLAFFFVLSGCGDDDPFYRLPYRATGYPGMYGYDGQSAYYYSVNGKYRVEMYPLGSNCYDLQPIGSSEQVRVSQSGWNLTMDFDQIASYSPYSYEISMSTPPLWGSLYSDGGFGLSTYGEYYDYYTGYGGGVTWGIYGYFDYDGIHGTSETTFNDPYYGYSCTVSHSFSGYRY